MQRRVTSRSASYAMDSVLWQDPDQDQLGVWTVFLQRPRGRGHHGTSGRSLRRERSMSEASGLRVAEGVVRQ